MLTYFAVQNYRGLRKIEIDFKDKKNYQFNKECLRGDLLEKIVLIGENGVGKTNFAYALMEIVDTLQHLEHDIGQKDHFLYVNGCSEVDYADFDYVFSFGGSTITFHYTKCSPDKILFEEFIIDRVPVFRVNHAEGRTVYVERYEKQFNCDGSESVLRQIAMTYDPRDSNPARRIFDYTRGMLFFRGVWKRDDHIGLIDRETDIEKYIIDSKKSEKLSLFLRDVASLDMEFINDGKHLFFKKGCKKLPLFYTASRGTVVLVRLFCWIEQMSNRGTMLIFDDFDNLFHYSTAEKVMKLIISKTDAQCIFITHNAGLFSNEQMRPDCCFIFDKESLKSVSTLTDKYIRKGNNIEKMLKDGEFKKKRSTTNE